MKLPLAAAIAALLVSAAYVVAQETTPPLRPQAQRAVEQTKTILDLTDRQLEELTQARQTYMDQMREIQTQMRQLEQQRRQLMQSGNPDRGALGELQVQQRNLQQQVPEITRSYRETALAVLTGSQKEKVEQIQQALELARQAPPLAAFGLLEGPGGRPGFMTGPGMRPMGRMGGMMQGAPGPRGQ